MGRQESGQRLSTRPRMGMQICPQWHRDSQLGMLVKWARVGGIRGNEVPVFPQAGGVGGAPGQGEYASWPPLPGLPSRPDTRMMARGLAGRRGKGVELTPHRECSLGPRPPEPQICTFWPVSISSQTKLIWINRGLQFLPLWVFCGHHFLCYPWGD